MSVGSQLAGTFEFDGFLINFHGKHDFFMFLIKSERIFDGIHQLDEIDMSCICCTSMAFGACLLCSLGGLPLFV